MAEESIAKPPSTIKSAILAMNPRIVLAFFLVTIAAMLVVWLGYTLRGLDAGTAALIAGLVTLFVKMADSSVGYQYQSSAGSDKKDDTNATVQKALADKMPGPLPAPSNATVAWWSRLKNGEPAAITAAAAADARVMAFVTAANVGAATPDDLAYLVSKGLLTQERANAIQS